MDADPIPLSDDQRERLASLGGRYIWWGEPASERAPARVMAQIMNLGTYEDILQLEDLVPRLVLARVLSAAEPGWFSPRSWEFWRGRLQVDVPERPPARSFADAV